MSDIQETEHVVVLLALGNPSEAVALEHHLNSQFPDIMEIYRAPSGFDAMSLAMNRPQIVLLDQRLPDVMGLDMIDPIRDQIGAENYLIFIGGSGKGGMRPGMRDEALKRGASAICDRPVDVKWLTEMIRALLFPEVPPHPHLHGLELLDLIQAFNVKRVDRTMRIFARDGRVGSIYMAYGEITHIEAGAMQGFSAMLDLMRWTEGRIVVFDALLSSEKTNTSPTQHLLLEAARIMDEASSEGPPQVEQPLPKEAMPPKATPPEFGLGIRPPETLAPPPDAPNSGLLGDGPLKITGGALDALFGEEDPFGEQSPPDSPARANGPPARASHPVAKRPGANPDDSLSLPPIDFDSDFDRG